MARAITINLQAAITEDQYMTAQANWEKVPHPYQQVSTMATCFKDFTRMYPPTFYGSKSKEDPQ